MKLDQRQRRHAVENYVYDLWHKNAHYGLSDYIGLVLANTPVKSTLTTPEPGYFHFSHVDLLYFLHKLKVRPTI